MKGMYVPFGLAGMSVGMGIIGEGLGSPGLLAGGQAAGSFIGPAININAGGHTINLLKNIKDIKKGGY